MQYKFLLIILLLASYLAKAEVIDGPANFRAKPNGQILISLTDGQNVESGLLKNGWFEISVAIKITKRQFDNGYNVKKGDKLIDFYTNKLIGVALADISASICRTSSYGDKANEMEILGYVSKSNIKPNSIPENAIDSAIKKKIFQLQYDSLKSFLLNEEYKKESLIKKTLPQLTEYCIYESTVVDPSPGYRVGMIFENNELIAIEHSRPLKIVNSKEFVILGRNKIFIVKPPASLSVNEFVKKMNKANEGAD